MLNLFLNYEIPKEISRVSGIPKNWNKSAYNKKKDAITAFDNLIKNTKAKYILLSYNNEGILSIDELSDIIKKYGTYEIVKQEYSVFKASRNLHNRDIKVEELLWIIQKHP